MENYDHVIRYLAEKGVRILQYGNLLGKHKYVYFDTEKDAKHIIETSTDLPGFKRREPQFVYPSEISKIPEAVFNRIEQIGIVVRDIKRTSTILEKKYMIKPWKFYTINRSTVEDLKIYGNNEIYSYSIALCKVGEIYLKLIEPHDDKSIFSKHLLRSGEGLHHVCFSVDNIDKVFLRLKEQRKKIIQSGNWNGHRFVYFLTEKDLKFNACFYEKMSR